jgi:preprotein translocase subunit SecE
VLSPSELNAMIASTKNFVSEVKVELQKASWPWDPKERGMKKYKELVDSTLIVLIATLLMGGYVAGWDFMLNLVLGFIFN